MVIPFADAIFWIAVVSCLVAQIAIVRSVFRMRDEKPAKGMPRPRTSVEVAWVIIPAIALAGVLLLTWRAIHPASTAPATTPARSARVAVEASRPTITAGVLTDSGRGTP
jgi:heme/copper-type cytochrome/quinol oxidase subunit 2